jgi:hypothetical protein
MSSNKRTNTAYEPEKIEPFSTEREALDFVNDYAGQIAHETW